MKRRLTKAEYDALSDLLKAYYKADGDSYNLQIAGEDDPGELRRALDRVRQEAAENKKLADAAQAKLDGLGTEAARKAGDVAALEASWKKTKDDAVAAEQAKASKLMEHLKKVLVTDKAKDLAKELAGDNSDLLLPHLTPRFSAELDGETPLTRVLDVNGKPSALSIDDLKKEIVADKRFSAIIIASKATGGAGGGSRSNGGSAASGTKKFGELNDAERIALHKADPADFKRQADEHKASLRRM